MSAFTEWVERNDMNSLFQHGQCRRVPMLLNIIIWPQNGINFQQIMRNTKQKNVNSIFIENESDVVPTLKTVIVSVECVSAPLKALKSFGGSVCESFEFFLNVFHWIHPIQWIITKSKSGMVTKNISFLVIFWYILRWSNKTEISMTTSGWVSFQCGN